MNRLLPFIVAACLTLVDAASPAPVKCDADQLKQKIAAISRRGGGNVRQRTRTTVTEREVNAYLAFEAADDLPVGIVDPTVSILGADRVTGRAVVDLDRVRQQRNPTSMLDPVRYLRGRLMVKVTGLMHASDGVGRFELEEADIAGVPIPKFLLQQIVSYYSRSSRRPSGIGLDDEIALPSGIREIRVEHGQAIVLQ
jgi:hypothetical protein